MNSFKHFQAYKTIYEYGVTAVLLSVISIVNATSLIMEDRRESGVASFKLWEPFVWEFSSLILVIVLLRPILWLIDSHYSQCLNFKKTLCIYVLASLLFSVIHITGMVFIRKVIYWGQSMSYQFGDVAYEFFYEYRKDLISFISIIAIIHCYRFIWSRLQGEANIVVNGDDDAEPKSFDRILVKKLGKEFIVKISEIEWLESSGNYVNLHVAGRVYPTRNTLSKLIVQISDQGFCRVHRSYAVHLDAVDSITNQLSGSGEITLKSGKVINLSRRYHDDLKQRLR